jgi:hypothetical protein
MTPIFCLFLISHLAQSVRNNGLIESCETAAHILNSVMCHDDVTVV